MEYLDKQEATWQEYTDRIDEYAALPDGLGIPFCRNIVAEIEEKIFDLFIEKYEERLDRLKSYPEDEDWMLLYLSIRDYVLSKMFAFHCSEAEVRRFEEQNSLLKHMTEDMYAKTGEVFRHILDRPLGMDLDDIEIMGTVGYWADDGENVLRMEEDDFYGSDFEHMIPIIESMEGLFCKEIVSCRPHWKADNSQSSAMTDEELWLVDDLDDGTSWAEGHMRHPKLDHILMCYATHVIVSHCRFSIPDFLRMKSFVTNVEVRLQVFSENHDYATFLQK